jgi:hypothetical protein
MLILYTLQDNDGAQIRAHMVQEVSEPAKKDMKIFRKRK